MGADRNFRGTLKSLETNVRCFYGKFLGKGAAAIESVDCLGFTIERTGVGLFTITMDDRYPTAEGGAATPPLLMIKACRVAAAARATGEMQIIADNSAAAAKTITTRWAEAGAAADVTDTDVIRLELIFRNTSLPRKGA
jgi:hypothetical protein